MANPRQLILILEKPAERSTNDRAVGHRNVMRLVDVCGRQIRERLLLRHSSQLGSGRWIRHSDKLSTRRRDGVLGNRRWLHRRSLRGRRWCRLCTGPLGGHAVLRGRLVVQPRQDDAQERHQNDRHGQPSQEMENASPDCWRALSGSDGRLWRSPAEQLAVCG